METLRQIADDLVTGRQTSRVIVEGRLEKIGAADGEGSRAFIKVHAEQARMTADWIDRQRKQRFSLPKWAGIPVSIKDLFDEAGETTKAGSLVLANAPPAKRDAAAVARVRSAGFIPIGRTNMTEFAFSAVA